MAGEQWFSNGGGPLAVSGAMLGWCTVGPACFSLLLRVEAGMLLMEPSDPTGCRIVPSPQIMTYPAPNVSSHQMEKPALECGHYPWLRRAGILP